MSSWPDRAIAGLAEAQHGQVARHQLVALGAGRGAIEHNIARGRLHPTYRGVYAVGHTALPPLARPMGAVLACGGGAFLSHRSAASLWGLFRQSAADPAADRDIDVTVAGRQAGQRSGIRLHRAKSVHPSEVRRHRHIPVSSPARALLEVAPELSSRELERAFDELAVQRLATGRELQLVLARNQGRPGLTRLAALAEEARATTITRSEAEERLLALVRKGGLPEPEVNGKLGRYEVDFVWRRERLVVEVDGYAYHATRGAFERDRRRDAELQAQGFVVLRVTWRQLINEPEAVLVSIASTLARREAA